MRPVVQGLVQGWVRAVGHAPRPVYPSPNALPLTPIVFLYPRPIFRMPSEKHSFPVTIAVRWPRRRKNSTRQSMNARILSESSFPVRILARALVMLGCPSAILAVPSIKIDSIAPDAAWMPGDQGRIGVEVTYTAPPYPARVDFIIREVASGVG